MCRITNKNHKDKCKQYRSDCKGKGYNVFEREDDSTVSVRCEHCNGTTMVKQ